MQYLVIERYRDPVAVDRRLREAGRQLPEGLSHVASWVTQDLSGCYQVMECQDRALLDAWMTKWADLVEFEVVPVISSAEANEAIAQPG